MATQPYIVITDDLYPPREMRNREGSAEAFPLGDLQEGGDLPKGEPYSPMESHAEPSSPNPIKTTIQKFWWIAPILGVVVLIGGVTVLRLRNAAVETAAPTQTAPLPVQVTPAKQGAIQAWVSSEGTVQAARFKHLAFDTGGEVNYIIQRAGRSLRAGDRVTQGELLARIDDRERLAEVNKAQASIYEAQQQKAANASSVAQAQTQVAQARAQVQQVKAQRSKAEAGLKLAQSDLSRYQSLYVQGALSAKEIDSYRNAVQNAQADGRAAQGQIDAAEAQVKTAQAQVQAAQEQLLAADAKISTARSQLTQARVALEGTKLYAPFNGIVAYLNIREGEYYSTQAVSSRLGGDYQGITESVPIIVIDPSSFEVVADLPADSGERVRPGQKVLISSDAQIAVPQGQAGDTLQNRARAQGQVFAVNPAVSPGGRSIQVKSRILQGNARLQHGEQVSEWVAIAEKQNAVVVPLNAIVFRDQKPFVFVVNSGQRGAEEAVAQETVEQRAVELGINGLTQREILKGVKPGDRLVTEGQNRLVDGTPVKVTQRRGGS